MLPRFAVPSPFEVSERATLSLNMSSFYKVRGTGPCDVEFNKHGGLKVIRYDKVI